MDRKTRRKIKRELKKMNINQIATLVNALSEKDNIKNDLRYVNHINLKKED